jgi:serine/threonine protein kinase
MENIIDNYTKIKQLGHTHGGRSTWLAQDQQGCKVVVKEFVFGNGEARWGELKAIEQEANTLAVLDHPQIPKLLDRFETEQGYSIVMEYIEGETLAHRIGFPVPESQLTDIAKQALEILAYIHDQSLLHRDIKPENIIIGNDGKINLVDFGLSRNPNNVGSSTALMGTRGFMPLEQLRGIFKPASDLYGLGMTLICLATGTKTADAVSLVAEDFSVRFTLHSQCGRELDKWLHKLTAVSIGDRPQTATEAINGIDFKLSESIEIDLSSARRSAEKAVARARMNSLQRNCDISSEIELERAEERLRSIVLKQSRKELSEFVRLPKAILPKFFLAGSITGFAVAVAAIAYNFSVTPPPPQPLAHTPEYDALVAKYVDTNQINRSDLDLSTTKDNLSPQFSVYRFRHSKLQGALGYLTVLVNRSANNSNRAVSVRDINGKQPIMTIKEECLSFPQVHKDITKDHKICFD